MRDTQSRSQHQWLQFTTNMALRSSMYGGIKTDLDSGTCRCYLIKRRCRYQKQAHHPCTRPSKHSVPIIYPVLKPWYGIFSHHQASQSRIPGSEKFRPATSNHGRDLPCKTEKNTVQYQRRKWVDIWFKNPKTSDIQNASTQTDFLTPAQTSVHTNIQWDPYSSTSH